VLTRELEPLRVLYQEKGYYSMTAHLDSSTVDAATETVVVTIDEGSKIRARRIEFEGNAVFSDEQLRKQMKQSTGGFLKSATFKKQQFEEDKARIVAWYQDHGYLDATVDADELAFVEDREKVDLTLRVTEGPLYSVGDVNWEGNVVYDDIAVARLITLEKGRTFREGEYQETLQALHSLYWDSGHIYITIGRAASATRWWASPSASGRLAGAGAQRQVVDNLKTHDAVVLRECRSSRGRVQQLLVGLSQRDVFSWASSRTCRSTSHPPTPRRHRPGEGQEKQARQFSFGMAYSAQTSATGFIRSRDQLPRPRQNLGVAWRLVRGSAVDLNYRPWFRGTPTLVGSTSSTATSTTSTTSTSRVRGSPCLGRRIPGTLLARRPALRSCRDAPVNSVRPT
jgi:hypothetical protein